MACAHAHTERERVATGNAPWLSWLSLLSLEVVGGCVLSSFSARVDRLRSFCGHAPSHGSFRSNLRKRCGRRTDREDPNRTRLGVTRRKNRSGGGDDREGVYGTSYDRMRIFCIVSRLRFRSRFCLWFRSSQSLTMTTILTPIPAHSHDDYPPYCSSRLKLVVCKPS